MSDYNNFHEQVFFATTRITISKKNGEVWIGTWFLYHVSLNDGSDKAITLLVSNKHVFQDPKANISFTFNKENKWEPDLSNIHTFNASDFSGIYTEHPNSEIDLACINASIVTSSEVFSKNIPQDMIATFKEPELRPWLDVWFVWYPENRFDSTNNLPLLRKGIIASMPKINFNWKEQIIIDAQVFQGSSWSPVFTSIKWKIKLIWVVAQTMIKHWKIQAIQANKIDEKSIELTLWLWIVLKSTLLQELIDKAISSVIEAQKISKEPVNH